MRTIEKPKAKKPKLAAITVEHIERTESVKYVIIKIKVPATAAAVLVKPGYYTRIQSAEVVDFEESRMHQWHNAVVYDGKKHISRKARLAEFLKQPLDTEISVYFKALEWRRIEWLCRELKIQPADWLLSSVAYNADLELKRPSLA